MKGKIKVKYDESGPEITIIADEKGLAYLADVCKRIAGKDSPAGHFHLMAEMKNLVKGSVRTTIIYSAKV
ncbi:MAG: hypothetical protein IPQ26_10660 [Elusimicrobia bacterium]|nr:hypothetical protein [Elusimicrobiota bacterium]